MSELIYVASQMTFRILIISQQLITEILSIPVIPVTMNLGTHSIAVYYVPKSP